MNEEERVPWSAFDVVYGLGSVMLLIFLLLGIISLIGSEIESQNPYFYTGTILLFQVLFLGVAWRLTIHKYRASWSTLGFVRVNPTSELMLVAPAVLLSLTFSGVYKAILLSLGMDGFESYQIDKQILGEGFHMIVNILAIVAVGPFVEEVFFRGFVVGALIKLMGRIYAILAGAMLFAISHLLIASIIPVFVSGLILSWLYLRTRSLWPPIAAHSIQNVIVVTAVFQS